MLVKRIVLALVSLVVGYAATWLITFGIGTNLEEYGGIYSFLTALSIACALGVWLDKFMDTKILPE